MFDRANRLILPRLIQTSYECVHNDADPALIVVGCTTSFWYKETRNHYLWLRRSSGVHDSVTEANKALLILMQLRGHNTPHAITNTVYVGKVGRCLPCSFPFGWHSRTPVTVWLGWVGRTAVIPCDQSLWRCQTLKIVIMLRRGMVALTSVDFNRTCRLTQWCRVVNDARHLIQ